MSQKRDQAKAANSSFESTGNWWNDSGIKSSMSYKLPILTGQVNYNLEIF
jgi:hypothetical protein